MQRIFAFALVAVTTNFTVPSYLTADDNVTQRGYIYFAPGSSKGTFYSVPKAENGSQGNQPVSTRKPDDNEAAPQPLFGNLRESLRRRPLFFRRSESQISRETLAASPVSQRLPEEPSANRSSAVAQSRASAVPVSQYGRPFYARPVTYGARYGLGSMYPAAIYGQAPAGSQPNMNYPPSPTPAQGNGANINPGKLASASRSDGCYDNMTYYSPAYNSGYYTSGCYQSNACCRTSRRQCTLFGGMFRGCGCSCYSPPSPPCPTTCYADPCYAPMGTNYAPPAYGTPTPAPSTTPSPPAPANPVDDVAPPQPIQKKVTPEPQAKLSPRIPGLPPDA